MGSTISARFVHGLLGPDCRLLIGDRFTVFLPVLFIANRTVPVCVRPVPAGLLQSRMHNTETSYRSLQLTLLGSVQLNSDISLRMNIWAGIPKRTGLLIHSKIEIIFCHRPSRLLHPEKRYHEPWRPKCKNQAICGCFHGITFSISTCRRHALPFADAADSRLPTTRPVYDWPHFSFGISARIFFCSWLFLWFK